MQPLGHADLPFLLYSHVTVTMKQMMHRAYSYNIFCILSLNFRCLHWATWIFWHIYLKLFKYFRWLILPFRHFHCVIGLMRHFSWVISLFFAHLFWDTWPLRHLQRAKKKTPHTEEIKWRTWTNWIQMTNKYQSRGRQTQR